MSEPRHVDQEHAAEDLGALQDEIWRNHMCKLALAVRKMWIFIGEALGIDDNAVHALTNLAKASSDNTLSISELAAVSDLTIERAAAAIDALVKLNLAVRTLPRADEELKDRRVRLPSNLVAMIFEYYRLQPENRALLGQFTAEQIKFGMHFLEVVTSIAEDQAAAIHTGRIDPTARLNAVLDGTG